MTRIRKWLLAVAALISIPALAQVSIDNRGASTTSLFGGSRTFSDHPNRIHCVVTVSTATTIQAVGGSCVAPGAGLSIYITDVVFSASATGGTAADSFPTIKSGTGGTCGSNTAVIWGFMSGVVPHIEHTYATPIKVTANHELCWINSTAGSKFVMITGYIAP